jgi:agmatine deiminase
MKQLYFLFVLFLSFELKAQKIYTTAPNTAVRSMAEWEEQQAIMIAWKDSQRAILREIVRHARKEAKVIILCNSSSQVASIQSYLSSSNIPSDEQLIFQITPTNTIWIRDYGANTVYFNDVDSLAFIDWRYNRLDRNSDDTSSFSIARLLKKSIFQTLTGNEDLVNTGGNFMSDGLGTAFASKLILEENAGKGSSVSPFATLKSEAKIDSIMNQYMGINRYIKMENLPFDKIHHIDMHMKLLDEETLLVGEYPAGIADGPQIEANLQYVLSKYKTAFGNEYEVVRMPMPPDEFGLYPNNGGKYRTYANALMVNKSILVPIYEPKYDTTALKIWRKAMRGYNVVGINCNNIIGQNGAIHCITKEIGVDEPLWITHSKIKEYVMGNPFNTTPFLNFKATIKHKSGIQKAEIYVKAKQDSSWRLISMQPTQENDVWAATLNENQFSKVGDTLFYYIAAEANNGKKITRPLPGEAGALPIKLHFWVKTDEISTPANIIISKIYPNPAKVITCIEIESNANSAATIEIYDINGRLMQKVFDGILEQGINRYFFDASLLLSGVYLIQANVGNVKRTAKIIVAN